MHEFGLSRNIVAIVGEHAGGRRVKRICLAMGPLACVEPKALEFCFSVVAEGTPMAEATLEYVEAEGDAFLIKEFECEEAA